MPAEQGGLRDLLVFRFYLHLYLNLYLYLNSYLSYLYGGRRKVGARRARWSTGSIGI